MMRIRNFGFMCLLICGAVFAQVDDAGVKVEWGYKGNIGPEHWAQLSPAFTLCATGKVQSPVNIMKKFKLVDPKLTINYAPAPLIVIDDGTTTLQLGAKQTIFKEGHGAQINFHANNENIVFAGDTYHLVEIHFHSPSENQLHGSGYPLEIHFVHQGENGKAAVIGVFVEGGEPNPALQKLIDHLPTDSGKEHDIVGEQINPLELLPKMKNHYSFMGSLTTPPCTEGVRWFLLDNAITATPAQILQLRKAAGGANARPIQPLNHRAVTYSMEKIQ